MKHNNQHELFARFCPTEPDTLDAWASRILKHRRLSSTARAVAWAVHHRHVCCGPNPLPIHTELWREIAKGGGIKPTTAGSQRMWNALGDLELAGFIKQHWQHKTREDGSQGKVLTSIEIVFEHGGQQ